MKRSIQAAGRRYTPSAEFRKRMQPEDCFQDRGAVLVLGWTFAAAAAAIIVVGTLNFSLSGTSIRQRSVFSEIADLQRRDGWPVRLQWM